MNYDATNLKFYDSDAFILSQDYSISSRQIRNSVGRKRGQHSLVPENDEKVAH